MKPIYIQMIKEYYHMGVSIAGITSLLYHRGFTGMAYMELRKNDI